MSLKPMFMQGLFPVYFAMQEGFSLEAIPENNAYILDGEGWKVFKKSKVSISVISIKNIEELPKIEEDITLTAHKISPLLINKVTAFFKAVYDKDKTEAVGYLYYNPTTGEWDFIPPPQTATSGSASYDKAPKKEGWTVSGTIHSHGFMSAFHSGTDQHDEEFFDGVHITIGHLDKIPEYACSIMSQGARSEFKDLAGLIEGLAPTSVPKEWMEAVKLSPPPAKLLNDTEVGEKVEKLYARYFAGKISEKEYMEKLELFEYDVPIVDATKWGKRDYPVITRNGRWGSSLV